MATYKKMNLSPSGTEGAGNQIALGTSLTHIHDTATLSTVRDEVWLSTQSWTNAFGRRSTASR